MTSQPTEFFVPGIPAPQGSKRHVGGGIMIEASKRVKPWRDTITTVARLKAKASRRQPLIDGPVTLNLEFIMPRTRKMAPLAPLTMTQRPDLDKLIRAALDGLTGPIFNDDAQVTHIHATKRRAQPDEPTGLHITIQPTPKH